MSIIKSNLFISLDRLLAAPLVVEGSEKTTAHNSAISGSLTLASLNVVECLIDSGNSNNQGENGPAFIELLTFPKESTTNTSFPNKTDFEMKFDYTERAVRHGQKTKYTHPRTKFE